MLSTFLISSQLRVMKNGYVIPLAGLLYEVNYIIFENTEGQMMLLHLKSCILFDFFLYLLYTKKLL